MIVDANAYAGRWPFRRLTYAGTAGLKALMQRTGTDMALVTPIAAAFYRDCLSAMEEMLEDEGWDEMSMHPVAVVNPVFPGWEQDLDTMVREMGCLAVRLLPNYHGYQLYRDEALALVARAHEHGLPAIITLRMQDERSHHWHMSVNAVSTDEVRFLLRQMPHVKFMLSNVSWHEVMALRPELELARECVWEMSYKPPAFYLENAVKEFGAARILYGSGAILQYPEAALLPVQQAAISDADKAMILAGNAKRVFGIGG